MKHFLTIILRFTLSKYYGLDKIVIMPNRYWPNRFDTFNLIDFLLSNKQNESFPINVGAHGLAVTGRGQPSHYYEIVDSFYKSNGKEWRMPDMKRRQERAITPQRLAWAELS